MGADIDDCGSRLDPVFPDHFRTPDRGDENIRLSADFTQVPGAGVTDRNRGIALDQQQGRWHTHNIGTAQDHRIGPFEFDTAVLQQVHATVGSAGHKQGLASFLGQAPHIDGMETIHILFHADGPQNGLIIQMAG